MVSLLHRRRQARRRRREIARALRSEFELEPRRGLAAFHALVTNVGELERARMTARAGAMNTSPPTRRSVATTRPRSGA